MPLDLPDNRASSDQPIARGKPTSHLLIRGSGLDYFRVADNSVLFVGATNLIPPVSTSSLAAGRHNRKNQLDR